MVESRMKVTLYAPRSYCNATPAERAEVGGGCGPGGLGDLLVPDSIVGMSIWVACHIHEWMYERGRTLADKDEADRVFLNNMVRLVEAAPGNRDLKRRRLDSAWHCYQAVSRWGGPAFWDGKNKSDEEWEVEV